jgi:predicted MPP superfamily phosphohydrolase
MLVRLSFFILFLFILDLYLFSSISSLFNKSNFHNKLFSFTYWLVAFVIYFIIFYVFINYERRTPSVHFNNDIIISSFIFIILFSKLIALFPIIFDDFLRVFRFLISIFSDKSSRYTGSKISRIDFLQKLSVFLGSSLFLTLASGIIFGRYNFKIKNTNVKIRNWNSELNGLRIVHISDLHLGGFNSIEKLEEVVDLINNQNPDIFVFTGDLVNNYYSEAIPYVKVLQKIKSKYGKFSVLGNHDYCDYVGWKRSSEKWKDNFKNMISIHKEIGFDLLLNEHREIRINNISFNLVGVENWGAGNFNKDGDLKTSMNLITNNNSTILLSHDPSHWTTQVLDFPKTIDLQLAGHTHGMQFGVDTSFLKWSPVKWRYKQWAGLYSTNNKHIYVNTGIGHLGYAGRVGIMPEITVLNLYS